MGPQEENKREKRGAVTPLRAWLTHPDRLIIAWCVVFFLCMIPSLNNSYPYMGDESFYTVSAMNMIQRGEPLAPFYFGEYRFNKPILAYWVVMGSYYLFGFSMWSGRVPFLLVAVLTLLVTYRLAFLLFEDRSKALLSAVILSATYNFVSFSRIAITDPLLTFFCLLAILFFVQMIRFPERTRFHATCGAVCVGLAVMTKGPVGLFPWFAALGTLLLFRTPDRRRSMLALLSPLNVLIVAAMVSPWYVYIAANYPQAFAGSMHTEAGILLQIFDLPGLGRRFLYYSLGIIVLGFPFTAAALYVMLKKRALPGSYLSLLLVYLLGSTAFFVLFTNVFKERYLLMVFPPGSIVLADILYGPRWRSWLKIAMVVFLVQASAFALYPVVAREPLRELVATWKQGCSGTLGFVLQNRKFVGWCRLFAHDENIAPAETADFLIIAEEYQAQYAGWRVVRSAPQRKSLRFKNGKFEIRKRIFLLIEAEHPEATGYQGVSRMHFLGVIPGLTGENVLYRMDDLPRVGRGPPLAQLSTGTTFPL